MANYRVFILEEQENMPLGKSSFYSYKGEALNVYRNGKQVYSILAKKGDAFIIECTKKHVKVYKLAHPHKKGALVSWLMGFNKHNRGETAEEYEYALIRERMRLYWSNYVETEVEGEHYIFTQCVTPHFTTRNVAGFFSNEITKEEVLELVPYMKHSPDWYNMKMLQTYFGISQMEYKKAAEKKA